MKLFEKVPSIRKSIYEEQSDLSKCFSSWVEELQLEMDAELKQKYLELYHDYKMKNGSKNSLIYEGIVNNKSFSDAQYKEFDALVSSKMKEVENDTLSCSDFFNILELWKKKNG